jgi:hypothetical protein
MKDLETTLEAAGKWAACLGILLVVISAATLSGALLATSFLFLGPAYIMPEVVDWLRTRSAVAELRSRPRAIPSGTTTRPPQGTVHQARPRDPGPGRDDGEAWSVPLADWDSPSRSIH